MILLNSCMPKLESIRQYSHLEITSPQQSIVVFDIILVRLSFIESNDSLLIGVMVRLSLDIGLFLLTLLFFFSFHLSYGIIIYKR